MLPGVSMTSHPLRNVFLSFDRACAPPCHKIACGNQNNCCSRTRTHADIAAQDVSVSYQPWNTASHAAPIYGDVYDACNLSIQPSPGSLGEQECFQPPPLQLDQQDASHTQQQKQHHTQRQGKIISWTITCSYSNLTKLLAAASVVPALLLAVDPLAFGGISDLATNAVEAASAWQGPLRDLFSFTVLLSVFITSEPGAAAASAVSATGAAVQLMSGPALPPLVACCTAIALMASATMVLLVAACMRTKASGNPLTNTSKTVPNLNLQLVAALKALQQAFGVLGGGLLAQFLTTLLPGFPSPAGSAGILWLLPVAAGAVAVLLASKLIAASNSKRLLQLWADWPAWSATLLLILQPFQQLVDLALQPVQLQPAISAHPQMMLFLASGLMVPRALLQRELMWFTGTFSGASLSAGQLALCATQQWTQRWPSEAGLADACRGTSVMVTIAALLVTCALLQAGWQHILAPTADGNTTTDLHWDAGGMTWRKR